MELVERINGSKAETLEPETVHVDELPNGDLIRRTESVALSHISRIDLGPNLAWGALQAGLAKERQTNLEISNHVKDGEKMQKDIDLLLDLSAELIAHKEGQPAGEPLKKLLSELAERNIHLWKGEDLSKEKISELKSLSSAQVDKLRSNLQILFTTKIQPAIQAIAAIMEALKEIIRSDARLKQKANQLPGH